MNLLKKYYIKLGVLLLCLSSFFYKCKDNSESSIIINNSETLYNGITLPKEWPPRYGVPEKASRMLVPYLENPPEIISINIGRQLFVDDFLIEESTLNRTFHYPKFFEENPVIKADKPWEKTEIGAEYASPFSDGVWYDEKEQKFKMWYLAGGGKTGTIRATGYAESNDGEHWVKPTLDVVPETNLVSVTRRDGNTIWLDKLEEDPKKRYKIFNIQRGEEKKEWRCQLKYSADGIHWSESVIQSQPIGDRSTIFYNPFRKTWVYSLRQSIYNEKGDRSRVRNYLEHPNPETLVEMSHTIADYKTDTTAVKYWFGAWDNEVRHPDYPKVNPGIYNHDAIAYESLILGFFNIWQGPENNICDSLGVHKRNELLLGYSRDGFHWNRPDMNRFMGVNRNDGSWNNGNMQSIGGVPLIVGDSLYFYSSGRQRNNILWDSKTSTGLAKLRRDGFASLDATENEASVTTRKLSFNGQHLFVNVDASKGQLLAELLDEHGNVIEGYSKTDCIETATNGTKINIQWKNNKQLMDIHDRVKIKFYLTNASLYSFWISNYQTGESSGYTAGGGPRLHPSGKDLPLK